MPQGARTSGDRGGLILGVPAKAQLLRDGRAGRGGRLFGEESVLQSLSFLKKCRKSARKGAFFLFICGKRSAAGGESFRARRGDERFRPPGGRTVGPTISFLQKETVPPGGTREKSSGVTMPSAPPEAKKHPRHPHRACGKRFHPAKIPRPKRRGLRGNMVPPSNRARPAMRCRTAFPQKCRDCPPGAFSLGPLQRPVLFCSPLRTAQRGPRDFIGSGRPTQGLPASNAALAARPRWAVAASPRKREWGAGSTPLGGDKVCGLWPHRKVRPRNARNIQRLEALLQRSGFAAN